MSLAILGNTEKSQCLGFLEYRRLLRLERKKGFQKKRLHPEEAGVRMKLQATHYKDANLMILCIIGDAMFVHEGIDNS